MHCSIVWIFAVVAVTTSAKPIVARDSRTAVVNFANDTGTPQHLASGLLYGVPDAKDQIPPSFFTDIGYNYERAGGAQIPAPGRGWIWGLTEYKNRFASVLSNYNTARQFNANFIFLIHDLWGADGTQNSSAPYPGDNGDWASWDNYLDHVIADMNANDMTDGMIIDIWNEPDLSLFWNREQDQYLQTWGRTFSRLRNEFGSAIQISGPAYSRQPDPSDSWWKNWCSFVSSNQSIPDQYAWHMETGGGDMLSSYAGLVSLLETYHMPSRLININEYAVYEEQVPAGTAWWISQLERVNAYGLRGNWLSGYALHDFMASLLSKPGAPDDYSNTSTGYFPNGDYQVYKYYNLNMTGSRVGSLPSSDLKLETYATVGSDDWARVLVGVRNETGTWDLRLEGLSELGLPMDGALSVHTWGFPVAENVHYGEVDGPTDLGWYDHDYQDGTVTFPVYQEDTNTTYAFEFKISA